MDSKDETLKKYRLKGIEVNRKVARILGKLNDHKQLMVSLAEVDDVVVSRIVRVVLSQGCGPNAIVERLKRAQEGLYKCQSYSKKNVDIALLSLRLGGPRLLNSLSEALNLPSLSTIYRHAERSYLRPSIAFPTEDEVLANIESMCGRAKPALPSPGIRGCSILIDEIALEERVRYSTAEDALIGFCRECISKPHLQNITGRPVEHLFALKKLLDAGKCHRAKEATVVAIAPFGPSHYAPMVIIMSGTCKTETVDSQLQLLKLAYKGYKNSPHGAAALGPIWSFATDGDARRRLALYRLCMTRQLSPPSELYSELSQLEFMNLACGEDDITHDGDFKHEEKRFASALRSGTGIYVNGMHISPGYIKQMLRSIPTISPSRLDSLFDNSDRQSVPKAHTLLKGIYDASRLPHILKQPGLKSFVLLGELLHAFYAPHTTPSMSLSQQVIYLAKCAFILFALYRLDTTRFITSQLYYDIQASIKNAIFCIAKTQILDPMQPFYLIHLGDDRLENLFGIYRTTSTNRNPDLLQLAERASAAQEVDNILTEYPNYDRKPYRLSVEGASGIDHLNPRSWTGDVCVANVNLRATWSAGRAEAENALQRAGIEPNFDLKALRDSVAGLPVDLMRPFGHYVGLNESTASEDNLDPSTTNSSRNYAVPSHPSSDLDSNHDPNFIVDAENEHPDNMDSNADLTLEELLPPVMPAAVSEGNEVQTPTGLIKRGWIKIDSRWVHLESAARLILGTESTEKSTDRLRRVCGLTRDPFLNSQSDSLLGDICLIGQPLLGLIRTNNAVALAAVRVTSIRVGEARSPVESISLEHLNRSDVTMTGQVLTLKYEAGVWYWNQSYSTSSSGTKGKRSAINNTPVLVTFHSRSIELVNPNLSEHLGQLVWSFKHEELMAALDLLWSKSSESLQNIPVHSKLIDFPYQWQAAAGKQMLIHRDASQAIEKMPAEIGYAPCGFCGQSGMPHCKVTLVRNKKSTTVKSGCPFFDKFSYKPAEKTTVSSPCTNRPICCDFPECSTIDPIWSYNMLDHILAVHGQGAYNHAVNEGQFKVSDEEIQYFQLDKPFFIPGRRSIVLPATSLRGTKRQIEDSTIAQNSTPPQGNLPAPTQVDAESNAVASGSTSKR
ncbi:hypothetical protein FRC11_007774, partial [Ceratobasidium sp. 423]